MRAPLVIAGVSILGLVAAGGAWYGLKIWPERQFRQGLDQTLATLPAGTTASYKTADYSVPTRRATVTGIVVHGVIPGTPPQSFDLSIDSLETENANLSFAAAWSDAEARPTSYGPDAALPVADTIVMKGVTVHSAVMNMTGQSIRVSKSRLYPWALLHPGMPTWNDIQAAALTGSQSKQLADLKPILRAEAAALLGVGYDSYEVGPMKFTETLPGTNLSYSIRNMTGGTFDRGIMRDAVADVIAADAGVAGAFTVDRMTIEALDLRQAMTRVMDDATPSAALLDGVRIGRIVYTGFTVAPPGQPAIRVGELGLGPLEFAQGLPVKCEMSWSGWSIAREQLPEAQAREAFDQLELNTITMSFSLAYDWDVAHQRVALRDTVLKVNELGTLTLSAELGGVVADPAALARATLAHARLRFEDASLVDRLVRAAAAKSGADPVAFRRQIVSMVRQPGNGTVVSPALSAAGQAASDFIASPRTLTIELSPASPVPFVSLIGAASDPSGTAAMLGLVVTSR